jgi:prepilin-type N-terminal cleavage/methylation domain-containing protein
MKKAFSLVELMIVVAIIGILAAMVVPKVQDYSKQAKEAAAKENLQILRDAIELYASKHNGIPPGYINNDPVTNPSPAFPLFSSQLVGERYINRIPPNPFNGKSNIWCLRWNVDFPNSGTGTWGYLYKPSTKTLRLDAAGTDSKGIKYSEY